MAAVGLGILCLVCCTQADAQSPFWRPRPAPPPYSFSVEDENGNSLPTFVKDGRTFLLGEPGLGYNIRLLNPTGQRVEAVLSVDGRDTVSGQPGDYVNERGYVIPAYGSLVVDGFRRSYEEVAAFRFTSPEDSYSARRGTPQNVGVIGVAFFPEPVRPRPALIRRPTPRPAPVPFRDPPETAPSEASRQDLSGPDVEFRSRGRVNNLGTQFGETRDSTVTSVAFERASPTHPAFVVSLRYDDAPGLSARGIDVSPYLSARQGEDEPQAFPASHFAEPPPR